MIAVRTGAADWGGCERRRHYTRARGVRICGGIKRSSFRDADLFYYHDTIDLIVACSLVLYSTSTEFS